MDRYLTGATIRGLREKRGMTQVQLASLLSVSDKAVSKWETGAGYPDITLLEPIANALRVSVAELLSGLAVENANVSANMLRSRFYVCPICKNTVHAMGEAHISCHGIPLPPLVAEPAADEHAMHASCTGDELFVWADHDMDKRHHVVFVAAVSPDCVQVKRLYAEGPAEAHFRRSGVRDLYLYCNKDGLYSCRLSGALQ
ncbi:MAG: helix-turn-helix domain-containing protein [Coriobacteriales bacterium]|nr:helix-turn-helix domain-containing protein [Coriobacteriales bacterium]